jgi:dGTPase
MEYKNITFEIEDKYLSPFAAKSAETAGRDFPIAPCPLRTEYQRDRDRILHCKAFRRLKHKTQVFLSPEGDHYRTRLTHTLEVSQIARSISRALRLNEDLTESIALGHDLGHTPFGHAGETALREFTSFDHNAQSLRVVEVLEYDFKGMNLTREVRDGIFHHKRDGQPSTLEGRVLQYADRIAYINHDIDDAVRAGIITEDDLPGDAVAVLGNRHGRRINNMILDIVENSYGKDYVRMSPAFETAMGVFRKFMFDNVYIMSEAKSEEGKAIELLKQLYSYYRKNPDKLNPSYLALRERFPLDQVVCDFISSMTDRYAVALYDSIYIPKGWSRL